LSEQPGRARDRIPQWLFLAVTTAAGLWAGGRWLNPMRDGGFGWSLAWRLGHGDVLYRDIRLVYGPLSPYVLAATGLPFGFSSLWYLLVNWVAAIAAGWLLLECARRYLSLLEGIALVTLMLGFSIFVPGAGRLVLPYYAGSVHALALSLGALLFVQAPLERLSGRAFWAGVLGGLAFCCKPELGLAALSGLLVAAAARIPKLAAWIGRVLAGFGLVAVAAFLFAISCDSLASLRENSHLWPLDPTPPPEVSHLMRIVAGLSDPQWPLVVRSAVFRLLYQAGLIGVLAMLLARERPSRRWVPLAGLFGALAVWFAVEGWDLLRTPSVICLSTSAAFMVAAFAFFRKTGEERRFFMAFGVFAGLAGGRTIFSSFLSGPYEGMAHLAQAFTWILLLCLVAPALLTGGGPAAPRARLLFGLALLVVGLPQAWSGLEALSFPSSVAVETRRGRVFLELRQARFFRELGSQLRPGQRVLVLPETSAVDALFEVRQASPLLNHLPGWFEAGAQKRLIAQLESDPPETVVIFDRPVGEFGVNRGFGAGYGLELEAWVERRYRPVTSLPAGVIWRRRE
jgi:hypothetical protein